MSRRITAFKFFGFLLALLSFVLPLRAGSDTGADFLKVPIGSRGIGLGHAYTALATETDAMAWNPAGLFGGSFASLSVSHQELFIENTLDHLALSIPQRNWAVGFDILRVSYEDQETRNADREQTGSFGASDLMAGAAFAMQVRGLRVGTHVKMIRQELASESATGFAADIGAASSLGSRLTLAASARNLGPKMKFLNEAYRLPMSLSIGAAYKLMMPLTMAVDLQSRPYQDQMSVAIGSELNTGDVVSLRAGYLAHVANSFNDSNPDSDDASSIGGITAGLGLRFSQFRVDYALTPFGELGNSQSLTLQSWFGGSDSKPRQTEIHVIPEEAPVEPQKQERMYIIIDYPADDQTWWGNLSR